MGLTIYYITDNNADGKVCFLNKNTACFQEIFQPYGRESFVNGYRDQIPDGYNLTGFFPGKQVHVFVDKCVNLEEINTFISRLSTVFGKYSVEKIGDNFKLWEEYNIYNKEVNKRSSQYEYKVVVNVDDFETLNHFKYAMYMLRPLFEATSLMKRLLQPEIPEGLDFWQWMRIVWSQSYCSHNYFNLQYFKGQSVFKNYPQERFFDEVFVKNSFNDLGRFAQVVKGTPMFIKLGETIEAASQQVTAEYRAELQKLQVAAEKIQTKPKRKTKTKSNVE